ncbi:MAG: lipoate--protein ligase family protein [Verrucomicrobiota bacterium]|jgi:lipoate-protein ligase A
MTPWVFIDDGPVEPVLNMALDDALLEMAGVIGRPVLRWYGWTSAAASFGYFQPRAEVEGWTRLRPLLRRPTGGGLVPHLQDWTYAMVFPQGHAWHALRAVESYERMHEWIARALGATGVAATVADCCEPTGPGRCFEGWEKFDVLSGGRKLAGAAQRRNRNGLLIQGSLQPRPSGTTRDALAAALREDARLHWGVSWEAGGTGDWESSWRSHAMELARTRHGLESYQARR